MKKHTLYIAPQNGAANDAIAALNEQVAFSARSCYDHRDHLQVDIQMAEISAAHLRRLQNDKDSKGLLYDVYIQICGGSIKWLPNVNDYLSKLENRNRISDLRAHDPFKSGVRQRKKLTLPRGVAFGNVLFSHSNGKAVVPKQNRGFKVDQLEQRAIVTA